MKQIFQPEKGYRYNIDSFLLARFAQFQSFDRICDLGSGVGILGLLLLQRKKAGKIDAIEVQEELVSYAIQNIQAWKLAERMEIICDNWKNWQIHFQPHSFDGIISNPPYRKAKTGKLSKEGSKAIAKHETLGTLKDLIATAHALLKKTGNFCFIYPILRLEEVLSELGSIGLKVQRIQLIHPFLDQPATHLMIEARKTIAGEIRAEPPLVVYQDSNHYTSELEEWVGKKISSPCSPL